VRPSRSSPSPGIADYLIALAQAGAHVLVSSDGDLTSIEGSDPPIVTPRRFLTSLELSGR
jgi:hypothetical protein